MASIFSFLGNRLPKGLKEEEMPLIIDATAATDYGNNDPFFEQLGRKPDMIKPITHKDFGEKRLATMFDQMGSPKL